MRRGGVRLVDFEPVRGNESRKRRPSVIVSNAAANAVAARTGPGVITVVPVTSNVSRVYPFQVLLPVDSSGLRVPSKAQAEQVRSVSVGRLGPPLGSLSPALLSSLDAALRLNLAL